MGRVKWILLVFLLGCALTGGIIRCEFRNFLIPERTYYIYSPGYPRNYSTEIQCRWIVTSPPGYICRLNCSEIVISESPLCSSDRLLISNNWDPLLMTGTAYCGRRSFVEVSKGHRMSLNLQTQKRTSGGRFLCEVTAEKENFPTSFAKREWKQWTQ